MTRFSRSVLAVIFTGILTGLPSQVSFGQVLVGNGGDSLSDEYSTFWGPNLYGSLTGINWVEHLGLSRSHEIDFGPVADWGWPRLIGFERNYSLAGATSTTLLALNQHGNLAAQNLPLVFLGIGTNDYGWVSIPSYGLIDNYSPIYNGGSSAAVEATMLANLTTALDTIAGPVGNPTGTQVVLATVVDWGIIPATQAVFPDPVKRKNVTLAIELANQKIRQLAFQRGFPVIELGLLFGLTTQPFTLDGTTIINTFAPSDDPQYAILPDAIHPGSVWQGLCANTFLQAANLHLGFNFSPLSDQEILNNASLPTTGGTNFFDTVPYVSATSSTNPIDLGYSLPGSGGAPTLSITGNPLPGQPVTFTISGGLPSATGDFVIGASASFAPQNGGALVPTDHFVIPILLNAAGNWQWTGNWPGGIPQGSRYYYQMRFSDPGAIQGVSYSNAMSLLVQ